MSKIHDALRRAERSRLTQSSSSIDILAALDSESVFVEETGPGNRSGPSSAAANSAPQPGVGSNNTAGAAVPGEADFSRVEDRLRSTGLTSLQFTEAAWTATDAKKLFFLQPEHKYSAEREQFRTLRSRLYQVRGNHPIKTILVSSALPQEGKTFIAANLALAIGKQHERNVLLIDADLRNSALHKVLGAPDSPGLVEYLAGEAELSCVIQKAPIANLYFVPAGKKTANPAELIGNGRLPRLIDSAGAMFDWIIVDSPSAIPVTDASLIADGCDGVVLVIKANSTGFDVAGKACSEFRRKPLLGVVLNWAGVTPKYNVSYRGSDSRPASCTHKD